MIVENAEILSMAAEGKCIAKADNKVIFVKGVAPGDICDIQITKSKKNFAEGYPVVIKRASGERTQSFCQHFGVCGGCKWQHIDYSFQLEHKQKLVEEAFQHPVKLPTPQIQPIIPSKKTQFYRNKLEFTFSNYRWLENDELKSEEKLDRRALGFHLPGRFDRILDIETCYLQDDPSNDLRNAIREFVVRKNYSFYNFKTHQGFLRNLIIRNSTLDEIMVIVQFGEDDPGKIDTMLSFIKEKFPAVTSLQYVVNTKKNETFSDLEVQLFSGQPYITEKLADYSFRIGPKSFFQTNSEQALTLYNRAVEMAGLTGKEIVYDLYCGTGTISLFLSRHSAKVLAIDNIPEAIRDAEINSHLNKVNNIHFVAGDLKDTLTEELITEFGNPDIIITDPPRAGMHPNTVHKILSLLPERIVYVSCNPATQARDISLLTDQYEITTLQPVDMFPHTHHVENIALLTKRM